MGTNYRVVAIALGDMLKYDTSLNAIDRAAGAVFRFACEPFPNPAITSERAQRVHDWVLSLAKQRLVEAERDRLLLAFCRAVTPDSLRERLDGVLADAGVPAVLHEDRELFGARGFHAEVVRHCRGLFLQGNYFHAVFEGCKVYNVLVKAKAQSSRDGTDLMLAEWDPQRGSLKLSALTTDSERDVQDGVKFLAAGLMRAIRNPTAHEPALYWPISRDDCLDILSFLSFLFRQLDKAQRWPGPVPAQPGTS